MSSQEFTDEDRKAYRDFVKAFVDAYAKFLKTLPPEKGIKCFPLIYELTPQLSKLYDGVLSNKEDTFNTVFSDIILTHLTPHE